MELFENRNIAKKPMSKSPLEDDISVDRVDLGDDTMNENTCPKCSERIEAGWRYCPRCGTLTKSVEDIILEEVRKAEKRVLNLTVRLLTDKDLFEMAYTLSTLDEKQLFIVKKAMDKLDRGVPTEQVVAEMREELAKTKADGER